MVFKKKCGRCEFEYEYEGFVNLITICPNCNSYDFMECEFGYGPVVPCRIYHGNEVIGMVNYSEGSEKRYRVDSDKYNIHKLLDCSYLEALFEAKDILLELIDGK